MNLDLTAARRLEFLVAPRVDPDFWQTGDMPAALASRHMGRVVRAFRKHPHLGRVGLSQELVGQWMGVTQPQLSRIESGPPIVHLDRLIQWARILRIPQEHLWFKLPEGDQLASGDSGPGLDPGGVAAVGASIQGALHAMPATDGESEEPSVSSFERRLLDAYVVRRRSASHVPLLLFVGGFAGSGKSEFGHFLSSVTGWTHLDKDVLTRPLVECLLESLDADPNDRHTQLYQQQVRPVEYRCLMAAAFDNLKSGVSTVVSAPFLQELSSASWLHNVARRCATTGVDVAVVWVEADVETMHAYLSDRDAARDTWKLNHWDAYVSSVDLSLRPPCSYFLVDNSRNAATRLADKARRLAGWIAT